MFRNINLWLFIAFLSIPLQTFAASDITQTVITIRGEILGPTCEVKDQNLMVDFGTLTNKDLFWHTRSPSRGFAIEFECTTKDSYDVAISFTGQETFYLDLQRMIIIDGDTPSNPWGVAIQLTYENGNPIPINAETETFKIKNLSALNFKAFVQASQNAINNKNIRLGEFNAVANFLVEYQ